MSPLLTIFLFQLVLLLIENLGAQTINDILYFLYTRITFSKTSPASKDEARLRKEIVKVKAEMTATSAQDDFAKWAKLRRQFDKLTNEYQKYSTTQSADRSKFDSRANTIRWLSTNGFKLYVQWTFTRQPMYWLPKGWIPWYGEWLLSFPRAPRGSVSVQVWQMACGSVLSMVIDAAKSVFTIRTGKVGEAKPAQTQSQEKVRMAS